MVDVRKLVSNAPATLPKFPQDYQNPIIVPRPRFPNQFAKIALEHGQPTDCTSPLREKRKAKNMMFVQLLIPHIAIIKVTAATHIKLIMSISFGLLWSPNEPLMNNPIE
jgi:hypothetical protein